MKISFIRLMPFLFILPILSTCAQVEKEKWKPVDISYQKSVNGILMKEDSSFSYIDAFRSVYKWLISDVDGDNCPFQPTCSSFFVQSVKTTNLFQGIVMAADRLTRDINLIKDHYSFAPDGHFLDPPGNYTLNKNQIHFLPFPNK